MAFYLTKSMLTKLTYLNPSTLSTEKLCQARVSKLKENYSLRNGIKNESVNLAKELVCRVCAQEGCTPLLEKLDEEYDIMSAIRSITNITISMDDSLPQFICSHCLDLLKMAHSFKKTCLSTDHSYKSILAESGVSVTQPYYSKHDFNLILHKMKCKRKLQLEEGLKKDIKHEKKKDTKTLKKSKVTELRCSMCGAGFSSEESLVSHRQEGGCRRRACELCGQLVLNMTQHQRVSHGTPTNQEALTCTTCGKTFTMLSKLKSHMRIHSDSFLFYCDLCPYRSKYKYYLVMHMRTHTGQKPYKCPHPECTAAFVNPSNLNKHKLVHQDKQIKCALCVKRFRTKMALRGHHEAAHMNIKHKCAYCDRGFCYKSDLRKHEIRVHNRKKRDYIGGEPTYKQVERAMQSDSLQTEKQWQEDKVAEPVMQSNSLQNEKHWQQTINNKDNGDAAIHWAGKSNHTQQHPPQIDPTQEWKDNHMLKMEEKRQGVVEWGSTQVVTVAQEQPVLPCILHEVFYTTDLNGGGLMQPAQIVQQQTMQVLPGMSTVKKVDDKIYETQYELYLNNVT